MATDPNDFIDDDEKYRESEEEQKAEPEEEATPPEESEEDHPEEAEPEETPEEKEDAPENPYDRMFVERGLNRQFESVDDMMARLPFMNKWQTQLSQENAELKRREEERARAIQQRQQQQQYDPDQFLADPDSYLGQKYLTRDEAQKIIDQNEKLQAQMVQDRLKQFAQSHSDFNKVWPVMQEVWQEEPGSVYLNEPLDYLYKRAKERLGPLPSQIKEEAQKKIDKQIEEGSKRADTAGSGRKAPPAPKTQLTQEDLYKLPLDELKKKLGGYGPEEEY